MRYAIYESRSFPTIYVMPAERAPYDNCERRTLGWVDTFSRDGVKAYLGQYTKGRNFKIVYIDFSEEAKV